MENRAWGFHRFEEISYPVAWAKTARGWVRITPQNARDGHAVIERLHRSRAFERDESANR